MLKTRTQHTIIHYCFRFVGCPLVSCFVVEMKRNLKKKTKKINSRKISKNHRQAIKQIQHKLNCNSLTYTHYLVGKVQLIFCKFFIQSKFSERARQRKRAMKPLRVRESAREIRVQKQSEMTKNSSFFPSHPHNRTLLLLLFVTHTHSQTQRERSST